MNGGDRQLSVPRCPMTEVCTGPTFRRRLKYAPRIQVRVLPNAINSRLPTPNPPSTYGYIMIIVCQHLTHSYRRGQSVLTWARETAPAKRVRLDLPADNQTIAPCRLS